VGTQTDPIIDPPVGMVGGGEINSGNKEEKGKRRKKKHAQLLEGCMNRRLSDSCLEDPAYEGSRTG